MAVYGDEGGFIPLDEAVLWTANFRQQSGGGTRAHLFGKHKLDELTSDPRCVAIRAYYAIDSVGERQLVLVGVDQDEKDILDSGRVLDQSWPCPSTCDFTSPLNS